VILTLISNLPTHNFAQHCKKRKEPTYSVLLYEVVIRRRCFLYADTSGSAAQYHCSSTLGASRTSQLVSQVIIIDIVVIISQPSTVTAAVTADHSAPDASRHSPNITGVGRCGRSRSPRYPLPGRTVDSAQPPSVFLISAEYQLVPTQRSKFKVRYQNVSKPDDEPVIFTSSYCRSTSSSVSPSVE